MNNARAVCFKGEGGIPAEEVGNGELVVKNTFAVRENTSWFINYDNVVVNVYNRKLLLRGVERFWWC